MAGSWTSEKFPQFEQPIRALTEQHRELEDEPLHLAITYGPPRDPEDIFLLEVIGNLKDINQDKDLFEVVYEWFPESQTGFTQPLHLVLTGPAEFKQALEEGWPLAREIVRAVREDAYKVLHKDAVGARMLKLLRAAARRPEEAAHG